MHEPLQISFRDRRLGVLGIAYAASIGGLGSLIGSPPDAIAARGGAALDAAAREAGLQPTKVEAVDRTAFAGATSQAVAAAAFGASQGTIATPARGGLGFYVVRVDSVTRTPARSLDQARAEIVTSLREAKRTNGLADLAAEVEKEIDSGTGLADIAKEKGLTLSTTAPLLADGKVFGKPGEAAPAANPILVRKDFADLLKWSGAIQTNADGSAKTSSGGDSVGVAVAINVADMTNEASIGNGSTISADGLTVRATMKDVAGDETHRFGATSRSGARMKTTGVSLSGSVMKALPALPRGSPARPKPWRKTYTGCSSKNPRSTHWSKPFAGV